VHVFAVVQRQRCSVGDHAVHAADHACNACNACSKVLGLSICTNRFTVVRATCKACKVPSTTKRSSPP
jgi:hypothetical protein